MLDEEQVIISEELELLGEGLPVSGGGGAATICFSSNEAELLIGEKEHFIFCQIEISLETMEFVCSKYCKGVITARGGMTSHAAVVCRGINKPCVTGFGDFSKMEGIIGEWDNQVTVDGNNGKVYAGLGNVEKNNCSLVKIKQNIQEDEEKIIDIFPELCQSTETNKLADLDTVRSIIKGFGENGYLAVDSRNQIDMTDLKQVFQFCKMAFHWI